MSVRRFCLLVLSLSCLPALSQTTDLTVRLYSLHSEHRLLVEAVSGRLEWRTCEKCRRNSADKLSLEASGQELKIAGESLAGIEQLFIEGNYRIAPEQGFKLTLSFPLQVNTDHGRLIAIARVPLEDYVAAALAGESGTFAYPESLKAMAVAVRTYAARFKPRHQHEGFDYCDSTHCQALNFQGISSQIRSAVTATRGQLLWFHGVAAATFYHQNCGGTLAGGKEAWPDLDAPYLQQHDDPYCQRASLLPWKAQLNRQEVEKALHEQGLKIPRTWNKLEIAGHTPSGRVQRLVFRSSTDPPQFVSASSLRFAIGRHFGWNQVRSDLYNLETTEDSLIFTGRGAGHGVGLCQAGTEEMAKEGMNYHQILDFYYPGGTIGLTAHGLEWEKRQSAHFEMLTTGREPQQQEEVLSLAESMLAALESEVGWKLETRTQLKFYPSLDAYRNSTGQPGWIAAFTRGDVISLQPLASLRSKSLLESTLRHEIAHRLIETHAHPGTPLWFREGLVLCMAEPKQSFPPVIMPEKLIEAGLEHPTDRQMLERSYAAARTKVAQMIQQSSRGAVLVQLVGGLPNSR
ncbi:MAG TPA: SpoIID/LytB domain-containing protein [Candidatus Angelobacter sp.]|jgi:stage II sporulation protein D|nr:SpoIID/LytB domain-containing protein [Candidatus Angelobacter sp.]